jgi:MFS family permease
MAIQSEGSGSIIPHHTASEQPRLHWTRISSISIFWFALNFHWAALGLIILPSQVLKLAGNLDKGAALAFVLVPGAFVALFANPLFGMLSDHTRGRLAAWGRRRPYIFLGTIVNILCLIWMAAAPNILSLAIAYTLVQFASNAAQAPFHALLPDIVPIEQRGMVSGVMGLLQIGGNIAGVLIAGQFIDARKPLPEYQHELWLTYGIIMAIMFVLMLITIITVHETTGISVQTPSQAQELSSSGEERQERRRWFSRKHATTIVTTVVAATLLWGLMYTWNVLHIGVQINGDVQQMALELVLAVGILRLFDFNPRRDPDFAWVFITRLLMMLGIYTIQTFLQYYMKDVVGVPHPEAATTTFVIMLSLTSLVSTLAAGWLSDRFGRKRLVYISGALMATVGFIFIITHSLPLIIAAGAIFGLGYGAYLSVDWALVADVLPSHRHYARDMGVWNISLGLPQIIAPVLGGPLIDYFTRTGHGFLGFQILFAMAIIYCILGTITVRYIRGVTK